MYQDGDDVRPVILPRRVGLLDFEQLQGASAGVAQLAGGSTTAEARAVTVAAPLQCHS